MARDRNVLPSETLRLAREPCERGQAVTERTAEAPAQPVTRILGLSLPVFATLGVSICFFVAVFLTQSLGAPYPTHGDCWTEMDCITTVRNFADHGFAASYFNPTRDRGQDIGLPPIYVSDGRHPAGSYLVFGLLYRAGLSIPAARALPLALSALALLVFFFLTRRVVGEWQTPLLASLALAVEPAFYLLSDSLYYFGYDFLLKTLFWLCLCQATLADGRRSRYLALAVLMIFLQAALFSYEPLAEMGLCCVLFPLALGKGTLRERLHDGLRFSLWVGLGIVLAFATRFTHLAVLHGGIGPALHNFQRAVLARSVGVVGVEDAVPSWPVYFAEITTRFWCLYPLHVLLIVVGLGMLGWRRAPRPAVKLALVLAGAEGTYFLLMRQHAHQHLHTLYHLVFSTALLTAIALRSLGGLNLFGLPGTVTLAAALVVVAPTLGPIRDGPNLERHRDWSTLIAQSQALAAHIPADGVVVLNTGNDPKYGFFLGRTFLLRQGWDYDSLSARQSWGVRQLRTLDTRGRPLFVLSHPDDPQYRNVARAFHRVAVLEQEWLRVELFEVRGSLSPSPANVDGAVVPTTMSHRPQAALTERAR
jgi:hypothetical protein